MSADTTEDDLTERYLDEDGVPKSPHPRARSARGSGADEEGEESVIAHLSEALLDALGKGNYVDDIRDDLWIVDGHIDPGEVVRAILVALREPTDEMRYVWFSDMTPEEGWKAAIDRILAPTPPTA